MGTDERKDGYLHEKQKRLSTLSSGVTITSTAKPGTDAAKQAEKLHVYYEDGCICAEIPGAAPKAGTYTYSCTFDGGSAPGEMGKCG